MENNGFVRVAAAIPNVVVADCMANAEACLKLIIEAAGKGAQIVCFPELSITAYTCGDLFNSALLVENAGKALGWLVEQTERLNIVAIVGLPVSGGSLLFNGAAVFHKGKILGVAAKTYLPNSGEFYERRWFTSAASSLISEICLCNQTAPFGENILFRSRDLIFSIEICEDLWTPIPPSSKHSLAGSQVIFNLSASNELIAKDRYVRRLVCQQSARCVAGYVYVSAGFGESSTDLYFSGNGYIVENGQILAKSERFSFNPQLVVSDLDMERLNHDRERNVAFMNAERQEGLRTVQVELPESRTVKLLRKIDKLPFVPSSDKNIQRNCLDVFNIQIGALATRLRHIGLKKVVIGVSGGLDSTLALLVAIKTFDKLTYARENIIGITMPGFGTTGRTYQNAVELMKALGIECREISIKESCLIHYKNIGHEGLIHDTTFENSQARERTQILMDVANMNNAIVIGTGDLSELALGWSTYNGDHMSMYGINAGVPKTLIRYLVKYVADYELDGIAKKNLYDIIDTPISPELLPASKDDKIVQRTEDIVGPYELHDFFLYNFIRYGFSPSKIRFLASHAFFEIYDDNTIVKWLRVFFTRFFTQQFKRSCLPDGPKVGSISLSPRGYWRMPSDAGLREWIEDCDK